MNKLKQEYFKLIKNYTNAVIDREKLEKLYEQLDLIPYKSNKWDIINKKIDKLEDNYKKSTNELDDFVLNLIKEVLK